MIIKDMAEEGKADVVPFPETRSAILEKFVANNQIGNALANQARLAPAWGAAKASPYCPQDTSSYGFPPAGVPTKQAAPALSVQALCI
jgi:hypothetical protein